MHQDKGQHILCYTEGGGGGDLPTLSNTPSTVAYKRENLLYNAFVWQRSSDINSRIVSFWLRGIW